MSTVETSQLPIPDAESLVSASEHPAVSEVAREYNALTLHAISDNSSVSTNSLVMAEHADFRTKLEICLSLRPHLSTSVISPANPDRRSADAAGLIVVDGSISSIHDDDAGTVATSIDGRMGRSSRSNDVASVLASQSDNYNEALIEQPVFGGLFWRPNQTHPSHQERARQQMPTYLVEASKEFGLPIYVIGEDARPYSLISFDAEGNFEVGEAVEPSDIHPVEATIESDAVVESLLARGVFRVASRERRLVSSGELGRLAYYAENDAPVELLQDDETISFRTTAGHGGSYTLKLMRENGYLSTEDRVDGEGAVGKGKFRKTWDLPHLKDHVSRMLYLPSMPWIGREETEAHFGLPTYQEQRDRSLGYLDLVERLIASARQVASEPHVLDRPGAARSPDEDMRLFLEETGFNLYGYADEAARCGDSEQAERATAMAELLVDRQAYDKLRARRLSADSSFQLTREDLPSDSS